MLFQPPIIEIPGAHDGKPVCGVCGGTGNCLRLAYCTRTPRPIHALQVVLAAVHVAAVLGAVKQASVSHVPRPDEWKAAPVHDVVLVVRPLVHQHVTEIDRAGRNLALALGRH